MKSITPNGSYCLGSACTLNPFLSQLEYRALLKLFCNFSDKTLHKVVTITVATAASPPSTDHSIVFDRWWPHVSHLHGYLSPRKSAPSLPPQTASQSGQWFLPALPCDRHRNRHTGQAWKQASFTAADCQSLSQTVVINSYFSASWHWIYAL